MKTQENEIDAYNEITTYDHWVKLVRANGSDLVRRLPTLFAILRNGLIKFKKEFPVVMADVQMRFVVK